MLVRVVVDSNTSLVIEVEIAVLRADHHLGVLFFGTGRRTVLAVHSDFEGAAHLFLELERLENPVFGAGEVLAGRDYRKRLAALEESLVGMTWHNTDPAQIKSQVVHPACGRVSIGDRKDNRYAGLRPRSG